MDQLLIAQGSKIGLHAIYPQQAIPLVRAAHDRGVVWPLVKGVDNGGIAIDVKKIEPRTLTITRFVNTAEDAAQDVIHWSPADMHDHAQRALDAVWLRLNAGEKAAADWIEPLNEASPPGVEGWQAFGEYLCELVQGANERGMKLALPACNAGTPEWAEAQALAETGLFGRMKASWLPGPDGGAAPARGHILTLHEGWADDKSPVDKGFGDPIPGAPVVPGAGSMCFRYRYLYSLLEERDEVVPLVISEFYGGGGYQQPVADQVARFAWYDREARKDPYVLALLPFTVDPSPNWRAADYTYCYPAVLDYLAQEKDKTNAVTSIPPATPAPTHRVTATLLNVRQFPFTGAVEPPKVATLPQGTAVSVLGIYQPAALPFGWGCLSKDGNQWVSMQWLAAIG